MNIFRFQSLAIGCVFMLGATAAHSIGIPLTGATATFEQAGFTTANSIDGSVAPTNQGWAVDPFEHANQTAVFQTTSPLFVSPGGALTFTLTQNWGGSHEIGKFKLYVTTDAGPTASGGNTWIVIDPTTVSAVVATLTEQGDNSVLASGADLGSDIYTVTASTTTFGITGFRLDVLTDPSLAGSPGGPGRQANGNFVLTEFSVNGVQDVATPGPKAPEPATLALLGLGLAALGFGRRKLKA